jgi:hypothetical protein
VVTKRSIIQLIKSQSKTDFIYFKRSQKFNLKDILLTTHTSRRKQREKEKMFPKYQKGRKDQRKSKEMKKTNSG